MILMKYKANIPETANKRLKANRSSVFLKTNTNGS